MTELDDILYQVTRPARYTGGEWNSIVKDWGETAIRVALAYPDAYEIGMSNLALPILYDLLNRQPDVLAERVYAPWPDMGAALADRGIPLFSLETRHPLKEFDVIGFSLGHELNYTNVLNMLHLAKIPVMAAERDDSHPIVIAGGSCVLNPEPMADFIDLFVIGDGEEVLPELLDAIRSREGEDRKKRLRRLAAIPGIYVPGLYRVEYGADGRLKSITPTAGAPPSVRRRIVTELPPPVIRPVVPYIEITHDRGAVEIQRGCSRGCRFCQAGMIYRPVRRRPQAEIIRAVDELIANCGYSEVSLVSLSTSDYPGIEELVAEISRRHPNNLTLSLPSLRLDSFSVDLIDSLPTRRKPGLTFAPEAGSGRVRRIINKNIPEEDLLKTAAAAFERGWLNLKLYFMLGLPGETLEDAESIVRLVNEVYQLGRRVKGRRPQLRVSLATFIPKPHTPFQWVAQEGEASLNAKQDLLKAGLSRRGIRLSWPDPEASQLEAALSRGDRRLGQVIYNAWQKGSTFDAWSEHLNYQNWERAFAGAGLDPDFYARRERDLDELLPWSHIDVGVTPTFLKQEYEHALKGETTPDCRRDGCNACGLERWLPDCPQLAE